MFSKILKDKTIEKWSKTGLLEGLKDLDANITSQSASTSTPTSFDSIQFPTVKRVMASTIGGGGWIKSKKQQLKEDRINKLRKLKGKKPNVNLEKDKYVEGLVSVKPLSAPIGNLTYMDFIFETEEERRRKKLKKNTKLIRKDKLEYIDKILNNNDKKI